MHPVRTTHRQSPAATLRNFRGLEGWRAVVPVGRTYRARALGFVLLLASLFPLWAAFHNLTHFNDDTYITLTYVKSLVAGEGWRYNGGPQVLGTTTPLFALAVAMLGRLLPIVSLETLAAAFSTMCWLGSAWLFFLGHRALGLRQESGALVALLLLLQGGWWLPTLGMEATFLLFGLTLTMWLVARGHAFASGFVGAALFLVRPEGIAMVPIAGGWMVLTHRRKVHARMIRFLLGAGLPLFLWGLYAWTTFGAILPNSVAAKVGQGAGWPGSPFVTRLFTEWLPAYASSYGVSSLLSLLWLLVALGLIHSVRNARPLLLLATWITVFLTTYALLHAPGYWWYMLPVLFTLQVYAALGLAMHLFSSSRRRKTIATVLTVVWVGLTFVRGVQSVERYQGDARAASYQQVASWLRANTDPGDSVAFVEIGYLGFFSSNRIVDLAGLIEPAYTSNASRLDLESNFWLAEPDYLLYHPAFDWLLGQIVQDDRFKAEYREVAHFQSHLPSPLLLFQRTH